MVCMRIFIICSFRGNIHECHLLADSSFFDTRIGGYSCRYSQKTLATQYKARFVPNAFLVLARRPDEFRAFFVYRDVLMLKKVCYLSKADQEMIVTAVSAKKIYLYCVVAHNALLRIYVKNPLAVDQVEVTYHEAGITL